jgi:hypothetical protein
MAIGVGRAAAVFVPNAAYNQLIQIAQDLSEVIMLHSLQSSVVCHFNTESIRTSLTHFPSTQDRRHGVLVT